MARTVRADAPQIVLFVGGPDTGKSNFITRLWVAIRKRGSAIFAPELPSNVRYLEQGIKHLSQGSFVQRSGEEQLGSLTAKIEINHGPSAATAFIEVPDVKGEVWKVAATDRDIDPDWMKKLEAASAAVLFVRPMSKENVELLDWVTAAEWMRSGPPKEEKDEFKLPSQVVATELLNFLEDRLGQARNLTRPRVAIIAVGWDAVPPEFRDDDPLKFLSEQFPMFHGRVLDCERLDIKVFGVSIVGGDLEDDPEFRKKYEDVEIEDAGWVWLQRRDGFVRVPDVTTPLAWALGADVSEAAALNQANAD